MITKCPSCQKDVEHEDFLFEVLCTCGARFNPFMPAEMPGFDPVPAGGGEAPAPAAVPEMPGEFQESHAVFDELRSFGETMGVGGEPPPPSAPAPSAPAAAAKRPTTSASLVSSASLADTVVTSADMLVGMRIESYRAAVSAMADLDFGSASPLEPIFASLAEQAKSRGGNAVISVRWTILPDGTRGVASGTAVNALPE